MYRRTTNTGHTIEWTPDDEQAAKQAIANLAAELPPPVQEHLPDNPGQADVPDHIGQVNGQTARTIRKEYERVKSP